MLEDYEDSISLTLRTRSSRKPLGMQEENWKHQWSQLCLARHARKASIPTHHEDQIAGKGDNLLQHYNLVHKFIPMPQAMKIPAAKAAVDKTWEKLEKIPAWDKTKVRNKSEVIDEARTKDIRVHFASLMDILSFEECRIGDKAPKNKKVELYSEATLWKMILDFMQYSLNRDHQHHKWQQQKSWISSPDCQGAQDKQLMQYLLKPSSKWKMLQNYWKFPKSECPRHLDSSTTTQVAKIMVQYGRPSRSSWTKSVWSSFGRNVMGKAMWENPIEIRLGGSFQLGMLIRTPWQRIVLICVCGSYQIGRSWFGRNKIIPWPWKPGVYSKTMWNKQRYCWQLQNHVWIQNLHWNNWKITMLRKSAYFFVVLWHWRSCPEMCGTILWVGKQDDSATLQSIHSMHRWPPLQRRRIEIRGRIVKSMLSNCSEMLVIGTYWTTRYSMVSEQTCTIDHKMDQRLW